MLTLSVFWEDNKGNRGRMPVSGLNPGNIRTNFYRKAKLTMNGANVRILKVKK